ncbi:LAFE_0C10902g1_1 [Lachancea fermentati]|uniref:Large ribosomal subunit protein bL21m n=1 Tax=Lachancea fermentati TaxID=4955 RepID=A0A1G4MA85_LACFM|nr:LAFE_0C10902g1_1 [Lachancea fermentati]
MLRHLAHCIRGPAQFVKTPQFWSPVRAFGASACALNDARSVIPNKTMDTTPLKLSNELYAIFRIHNRPYLVTKGDKVYLPFKLKQAEVGDVLDLNDVTTIGSRNYKIVDYPLDHSLYTIKATILEKTKRPMKVREVTKRRNRKVRHAKSKADLTVLRISELKLN